MSRLLEVAAGHLIGTTAPLLGEAYEQSNVSVLGMLLLAVRHEHERAAARRVEENRELRRMFASARTVVAGGLSEGLAKRLASAAEAEDTDLSVSALEESNAELRGLLVELHAAVEDIDSPEARTLEEEIWRELAASTRRRA